MISVYGKIRVVRGCGYLTDEDYDDKACVKRSGTHDVFAIYCSCTGDLCNTAPQNTITNYMILFSTTLIALVFKNLQC